MSSKSRKSRQERKGSAESAPNNSRRMMLMAGVGGLGAVAIGAAVREIGYRNGWFGSKPEVAVTGPAEPMSRPLPPVTLAPTRENAIQAASDVVGHYTRAINNASAGIHALRSLGRNFTLGDGTKVVDSLCFRFASEREVAGRKYLYFPRDQEVHENSFLKTFLEAGVSPDQQILANGTRYTLKDLEIGAKALFRFDPTDLRRYDPLLPEEHLPWGLIAFSIIIPPGDPVWTNAFGEKIDFNTVIDRGLSDYEGVCHHIDDPGAPPSGEHIEFRKRVTKYSCFGMHSFYGFFSCYKHGFRQNNLKERLIRVADHLIVRLDKDAEALKEETEAARSYGQQYFAKMGVGADGKRRGQGPPPAELLEVMSLNNSIITSGHALEALNYVRLHNLLPLSPKQIKRLEAEEETLFGYLVKLRSYNLDAFYKWDPKFVNNLVIATSHALRAIKLLGPNNPDTAA